MLLLIQKLLKLKLIALPLLMALPFLLQPAFYPAPALVNDLNHTLDLTNADSVRVSLYTQTLPDSVRLTGGSGSIILYTSNSNDSFHTILTRQDFDGYLVSDGGVLTFTGENGLVVIDSLTYTPDSSSTRLITDNYGYRHYSGKLHFKQNSTGNGISIINHVDLETYVASVVGSEMEFRHPEALKAQAVVSRTYALWSIEKSPYDDFDVRDHESSQVYFGNIQDKPWFTEAASATKGEILTWSNQLILASFFSTCGGKTADNSAVWGGTSHPYLSVQDDAAACSLSPYFSWKYSMDAREFDELVRSYYGFDVAEKRIKSDRSGRASTVMLIDNRADTLRFTGNEFRLFINRHVGSMALRSTKYNWVQRGDTIVFTGNGLGHGVGMCQWGALGLAQSGWNYKDILTFYFSGTKVVSLDSLDTNRISLYN